MATRKQIEDLTNSLRRAYAHAMLLADHEDGGTCNFDTPQIMLTGWTDADIKASFDAAGLTYYIQRSKKIAVVDIVGCTLGQGNRRNAMAEATRDSLRIDGYDAYVYYQID